jgi:cyclic pyranopterin phosphate synthase
MPQMEVMNSTSSTNSCNKTKPLSHVDAHGKASMVDVSSKPSSTRVAIASGKVRLGPDAFQLVSKNQLSKGDVLAVAKIAGIQGAKQTGNLIPLCHNIMLTNVQVNLELNKEENVVEITSEVSSVGTTGVEMEALTAVSVAALTVYDMCKAVSKDVVISDIQLDSKKGGKSGDWCRNKLS